jgi:hypothetical protein
MPRVRDVWLPNDIQTVRDMLGGGRLAQADRRRLEPLTVQRGRARRTGTTCRPGSVSVRKAQAQPKPKPKPMKAQPKPVKVKLAVVPPPLPATGAPLHELADAACHWPMSGEGHATLFCGALRNGSGHPSYCHQHAIRSIAIGAQDDPRRYQARYRSLYRCSNAGDVGREGADPAAGRSGYRTPAVDRDRQFHAVG